MSPYAAERRSPWGRCALLVLALGVLPLAGCPGPSENKSVEAHEAAELPLASVTLRVAVVNDEPLRKAIDRLRGEWRSLTDGTIETVLVESVAISADESLPDLIVFPSRLIGELCEGGRLRPIRPSARKLELLSFDDLLPVVRDHEIVYGERVMALPLGAPAPLWVRAEGSQGVSPPQDDARLGVAFLAWAAPHVVHRGRDTPLFNPDNMNPRFGSPAFVRALDRFAEACTAEQPGEFVWPRRDSAEGGPDASGSEKLIVSSPPGALESYNPLAKQWEPLGDEPSAATLIASSGRLIGVTNACRNAATAFRFAAWLAGVENSVAISTASNGVANCRGSFARRADDWLGAGEKSLGREFAAAQTAALRSRRVMYTPRLPGSERYLEALGGAVRERLTGEATTEEALSEASRQWQAITEDLGRDAQRGAYLRSVNAKPMALEK